MNHNDLPSDELLQFVFGELDEHAPGRRAESRRGGRGIGCHCPEGWRLPSRPCVPRMSAKSATISTIASGGGCRRSSIPCRQKRLVPHFLPVP